MTAEIINLPDNIITLQDQEALESFGGHEIALGRATRFHWNKNNNGDPVFDIYRGGTDEELTASIGRHRKEDEFYANDGKGDQIVSGQLDHVLAVLDRKFEDEHDVPDDTA